MLADGTAILKMSYLLGLHRRAANGAADIYDLLHQRHRRNAARDGGVNALAWLPISPPERTAAAARAVSRVARMGILMM